MARTRRLTANLAREYARTACAIEEVLVEGYVSAEQEALEEAHLQARIESWDRDALEEQVDDCWFRLHEGEFSLYDDDREWEREQKAINRAFDNMALVRAWLNTRLV